MCTSLDPFPACTWHDDEVYDLQVRKEVEAAIACVKTYASNWPEVEWEKKDLGSLCVIVPNRHVVSQYILCVCVHICHHGNCMCLMHIMSLDIRQHGSAVYVGMVVVVCIP